MADWLYIVMLGFFITHELDAMSRHEWRVLPLVSALPEWLGKQIFIWAHLPFFALLFGFGGFDAMSSVALCLSAFAIVHVLLHILFRKHAKNEFHGASSWALIAGTGLCGALHLVAAVNFA